MSSTAARARRQTAAETRVRILDAARALFVERGYRSVSLRDIAAAAGISHPGLLRHFRAKDELLVDIMAGLEADNERAWAEWIEAAEPGSPMLAQLARRNATIPGYLQLFAALAGEASVAAHPAHDYMRARYRALDELPAQFTADAIEHGSVADDRDGLGEAVRVSAAWDGLQVLAQYLPERVDIVAELEAHEALQAFPLGWRDAEDPQPREAGGPIAAFELADDPASEDGYAVGRERRERIIADAMALFAREGYGDTSLRDIAQKVGVAKSTLLHHYPTKEELLLAVLAARDRGIRSRASYQGADRAVDVLRGIPLGAADNTAHAKGLIGVYAVLCSEAVPESHPAHEYFRTRFTHVVDRFASLFRTAQEDGDLPSHRDPEHEAIWLTALWDGLQYRWLYDPDAVDIAAQLQAHLEDVLPNDAIPPLSARR